MNKSGDNKGPLLWDPGGQGSRPGSAALPVMVFLLALSLQESHRHLKLKLSTTELIILPHKGVSSSQGMAPTPAPSHQARNVAVTISFLSSLTTPHIQAVTMSQRIHLITALGSVPSFPLTPPSPSLSQIVQHRFCCTFSLQILSKIHPLHQPSKHLSEKTK